MAEFTNTHPVLGDFWHPVALSGELGDQPMAVRVAGQAWALARIGGTVAAFPDACPHRRARLSAGAVVDGTLQCRYHGWRYAASGACVCIPALSPSDNIPGRATLQPACDVVEADGLIWLAPRTPRSARPLLPGVLPSHLSGEGIATLMLPPMRLDANAALLIDNFLDEAHFPFVHAATIGGAGPEPIARADVDRDDLSFTAVREHTFTNLRDPSVVAGLAPAVQRRRMTYGYQAPLHATLLLEFLDGAGGWQFLTFTVQPETAQSCRLYQTLTAPGMTDPSAAKAAADYEMSIFYEDLDLQVHALSGLEFPLDPAAELHTKADRVSVEFRRVLADAVKVLALVSGLRVDPAVCAAFPDLLVAAVVACGLDGRSPWPEVDARLTALEADPPPEEDPHILSWREAYRAFGTNPKRERPSVDALRRRLARNGRLPRISPLVDVYNLVSATHSVPAGAFDLGAVVGDIAIVVADGGEVFTPLGEAFTVEHPHPGEVIYQDAKGVLTRHWNHRDAERTKVTEASTSVVFLLETTRAAAFGDLVRLAAADLAGWLGPRAGSVTVHRLSAAAPAADLSPRADVLHEFINEQGFRPA